MDEMECGCGDDSCDYDGEQASVFEERIRTARKEHRCGECKRTIRKGERYHYASGCWEGSWDHHKTCKQCVAIAKEYLCDCYTFGNLRNDIWIYLGVDIITGETVSD